MRANSPHGLEELPNPLPDLAPAPAPNPLRDPGAKLESNSARGSDIMVLHLMKSFNDSEWSLEI